MAEQGPGERPRVPQNYRGINPTTALIGLGAVFVVIVLMMLARGGHDDIRPPEPPKSTQGK